MQDFTGRNFHFIAIGGIGMSALAKYLIEKGCSVTGSDIQESKYTHTMEELGAKVFIRHNENNLDENSVVVVSTAIKETNPEIVKAKNLNLPILHRSDLLQKIAKEFSDNEKSIFIGFSGTHGKTTTSGLCSYILSKGGYNPSYVVGGIIPELNDNAKYGSDDFFVAELDESDGTILKYQPDISVINNLEVDHIDFYKNGFEDLIKTFNIYLSNLKENSKIIINSDCSGNLELIKQNTQKQFITFALNDNADYTAKNIDYIGTSSRFEVHKNNEKLAQIELSVPGKHNVYNALAVFAALCEAEVDINTILAHFKTFTGMGRRFQLAAEFNDIKVIDDYAHHPSEIKTTIDSAKNSTDSRIVAIFQPHRYTRLKGLWNDFLTSFDNADKLIVLDVYAASEEPLIESNSEAFTNQINHKDAKYVSGTIAEAAKKISPMLKPSDFVITLGAGDITKLGKLLKEDYTERVLK